MSVTESPDNITIPKPSEDFRLVQPFKYLQYPDLHRTVLLILNQKLDGVNLPQLWSCTELHLCADGGADQLYNYFDSEDERVKFIPQFITGDLDSLTESVKQYYAGKGTIIIKQLTQYSTDFHKCLQLSRIYYYSEEEKSKLFQKPSIIDDHCGLLDLENSLSKKSHDPMMYVYALGGIGGRFDQTIGSIHVLYKLSQEFPYIELTFITKYDIVFLLQKGLNYIGYTLKNLWNKHDEVPVCGLLPLGNKTVTLNTKGLKYDVTDWDTDMLDKVSSSNGVSGTDGVIIETSEPIVINMVVDHHTVNK